MTDSIEDLLKKADALLSFKTTPQSNSRSKGRRTEEPKTWSPYGIGSLGPRINLPSVIWNFGEVTLKDKVVHIYEPSSLEEVSGYDDTHSVVLHGHPVGTHCPWGLQCHVFPCTPTGSVYGFNEKWKHIYD